MNLIYSMLGWNKVNNGNSLIHFWQRCRLGVDCIAICLTIFGVSNATAASLEKPIDVNAPQQRSAIEAEYGQIADTRRYQHALKVLNTLSSKLSSGWQQNTSNGTTQIVKITLVESQRITYGEMTSINGGIELHNLILSVELLHVLVSAEAFNKDNAIQNLTGAVALLAGKSRAKAKFPGISEKEASLRGIVEGVELATSAGFQPDCIYNFLVMSSSLSTQNSSIMDLLLNKDVPVELALSTFRTYVVSQEFIKGARPQTQSIVFNERLLKNLQNEFSSEPAHLTFRIPTDLAEVHSRLVALKDDSKNKLWKKIEFHRLLTFAMDFVENQFRLSGGIGPKEIEDYQKVIEFLCQNARFEKDQKRRENSTFDLNLPVGIKNLDWPKTRFGSNFIDHLREGGFFRSDTYQSMVSHAIEKELHELRNIPDFAKQNPTEFKPFLELSSALFLPEAAFEHANGRMKSGLEYLGRDTMNSQSNLVYLFEAISYEAQFAVTGRLYTDVWSQKPPAWLEASPKNQATFVV